jgi:hypothetical protein
MGEGVRAQVIFRHVKRRRIIDRVDTVLVVGGR